MVAVGDEFSGPPEQLLDYFDLLSRKEQNLLSSRALGRAVNRLPFEDMDEGQLLAVFRAFLIVAYLGSDRTPRDGTLFAANDAREALREFVGTSSVEVHTSFSEMASSPTERTVGLVSAKTKADAVLKSAFCALFGAIGGGIDRHQAALSVLFASLAVPEELKAAFANNTQWDIDNRPLLMNNPARPNNWTMEVLEHLGEEMKSFLAQDPAWSFWQRFAESWWDGTFHDWDLAREIIEISPEDWEQGYEHIGEVIAGIERDLAGGTSKVAPEAVRPDNVIKLFDRAPIVQASMASLSQTVSLHVDVFARLGQPNEIVPIFETLKTLPRTANQISSIIAGGQSTDDERTALALEVGRLRAEIAQLKADLEAAHSEIEQLSKRPWWKKTSVLLAGGVIPAIATGIWVLSGDDKALEERWNKLAVDLEFLSSKIWPDADDQIIDEFRFELPDGVDA